MSKPHPLAEQIKKWADDPDAWQWQLFGTTRQKWINLHVSDALSCSSAYIRLIPKRSLIPSDRLPEGWEVERKKDGSYILTNPHGGTYRCVGHQSCTDSWLFRILSHIDPEVNDG